MKRLLMGIALLSSVSSYACTCMSTKDIVVSDLAAWKNNAPSEVKVSNLNTTITPIVVSPIVRSAVSRDAATSCDLGCSQLGIRITADVEYKEDDKNCKAQLTKPARYESKLFLKNISCE
jgi:hypothetical protein